jgi:hypothetical protein
VSGGLVPGDVVVSRWRSVIACLQSASEVREGQHVTELHAPKNNDDAGDWPLVRCGGDEPPLPHTPSTPFSVAE